MFLHDAVIAMMSEALCVVERESLLLCERVFSAKTRWMAECLFISSHSIHDSSSSLKKKKKKKEKHQSSDVRTPMGYVE